MTKNAAAHGGGGSSSAKVESKRRPPNPWVARRERAKTDGQVVTSSLPKPPMTQDQLEAWEKHLLNKAAELHLREVALSQREERVIAQEADVRAKEALINWKKAHQHDGQAWQKRGEELSRALPLASMGVRAANLLSRATPPSSSTDRGRLEASTAVQRAPEEQESQKTDPNGDDGLQFKMDL